MDFYVLDVFYDIVMGLTLLFIGFVIMIIFLKGYK